MQNPSLSISNVLSSSVSNMSGLLSKILKTVENYFSNQYLWSNIYLQSLINSNPQGYVPLSIIADFDRIKAITSDMNLLICAVKQSKHIELNANNSHIRRINPLPNYADYADNNRSIYVNNLPPNSTVKSVKKLFKIFGNVTYIVPENLIEAKNHNNNNSTEMEDINKVHFTSAYVQFEKPAMAKQALNSILSFINKAKQSSNNSTITNSPKITAINSSTNNPVPLNILQAAEATSNHIKISTVPSSSNISINTNFSANSSLSSNLSPLAKEFTPSTDMQSSPPSNCKLPANSAEFLPLNLSDSPPQLSASPPTVLDLPQQFLGLFVAPKLAHLKKSGANNPLHSSPHFSPKSQRTKTENQLNGPHPNTGALAEELPLFIPTLDSSLHSHLNAMINSVNNSGATVVNIQICQDNKKKKKSKKSKENTETTSNSNNNSPSRSPPPSTSDRPKFTLSSRGSVSSSMSRFALGPEQSEAKGFSNPRAVGRALNITAYINNNNKPTT
jgi:hypothetical protein